MDNTKIEALLAGLTDAVTALAGGKSAEKKHVDIVDENGKVPVPEKYKGKHYYLRTQPGWSKGHYREKGELVTLVDEIPSRTFKPLTVKQVAAIRAKDQAKKDAAGEDEEPKTENELAADGAEEVEADEPEADEEEAKPAAKAKTAKPAAKAKRPSDAEV